MSYSRCFRIYFWLINLFLLAFIDFFLTLGRPKYSAGGLSIEVSSSPGLTQESIGIRESQLPCSSKSAVAKDAKKSLEVDQQEDLKIASLNFDKLNINNYVQKPGYRRCSHVQDALKQEVSIFSRCFFFSLFTRCPRCFSHKVFFFTDLCSSTSFI